MMHLLTKGKDSIFLKIYPACLKYSIRKIAYA